ncbi:hypothetical protein PoB_000733100 [Plakobranchus ocellatus]|uniref:Uncharacterized protein n=1 Tax=Plakobranchus ocellatus TaxID=259542 RepID=A0AAV3Y0R0_9GAST|nr:hypothetical protein PoB_000733100 [Plakobranchus ocellatus]
MPKRLANRCKVCSSSTPKHKKATHPHFWKLLIDNRSATKNSLTVGPWSLPNSIERKCRHNRKTKKLNATKHHTKEPRRGKDIIKAADRTSGQRRQTGPVDKTTPIRQCTRSILHFQ